MECRSVLSTTQFAQRKGRGITFFCLFRTLRSALESGHKARIVHFDFSTAFHRQTIKEFSISYASLQIIKSITYYQDLLSSQSSLLSSPQLIHYQLGSVWSILATFLSSQSLHVVVDSCWSKLVNVVTGVLWAVFWVSIVVPSIHFGAYFHTGLNSSSIMPIHLDGCFAIHSSYSCISESNEPLVQFRDSGLLVLNYFQFFIPNTHCSLVVKKNKHSKSLFNVTSISATLIIVSYYLGPFPNQQKAKHRLP